MSVRWKLPTSTPKQPEQCRMSQSIAQQNSAGALQVYNLDGPLMLCKTLKFLKRNKNLTFLRNTWCSTGNIPNIIRRWSVTSPTLSFDHEPEIDRLQWHIKALGSTWKILTALWHSVMQLSRLCQILLYTSSAHLCLPCLLTHRHQSSVISPRLCRPCVVWGRRGPAP